MSRTPSNFGTLKNEEIEEYLRLEHLMTVAKARAQLRLKS